MKSAITDGLATVFAVTLGAVAAGAFAVLLIAIRIAPVALAVLVAFGIARCAGWV